MTTEEFRKNNPINREEGHCILQPSCGPNLMLPNGEGQGRSDVPCFNNDSLPAFEYHEGEDTPYLRNRTRIFVFSYNNFGNCYMDYRPLVQRS